MSEQEKKLILSITTRHPFVGNVSFRWANNLHTVGPTLSRQPRQSQRFEHHPWVSLYQSLLDFYVTRSSMYPIERCPEAFSTMAFLSRPKKNPEKNEAFSLDNQTSSDKLMPFSSSQLELEATKTETSSFTEHFL